MSSDPGDPRSQEVAIAARFTPDEARVLLDFLARHEDKGGRFRAVHVAELIVLLRLRGTLEAGVYPFGPHYAQDVQSARARVADAFGEWLGDVPAERYIEVVWHHDDPNEPVRIYSEIDSAGGELRKVEVYADGGADYAIRAIETGSTTLSEKPIPALDEINADPQFAGREIDSEAFEAIWQSAIRRERPRGSIRVIESAQGPLG